MYRVIFGLFKLFHDKLFRGVEILNIQQVLTCRKWIEQNGIWNHYKTNLSQNLTFDPPSSGYKAYRGRLTMHTKATCVESSRKLQTYTDTGLSPIPGNYELRWDTLLIKYMRDVSKLNVITVLRYIGTVIALMLSYTRVKL